MNLLREKFNVFRQMWSDFLTLLFGILLYLRGLNLLWSNSEKLLDDYVIGTLSFFAGMLIFGRRGLEASLYYHYDAARYMNGAFIAVSMFLYSMTFGYVGTMIGSLTASVLVYLALKKKWPTAFDFTTVLGYMLVFLPLEFFRFAWLAFLK